MLTHDENKKIISKITENYCKKNHRGNDLCEECQSLKKYALARLENCPWGDFKPVCSKCPVHCYQPDMREKIKEVMRSSGPSILFSYPLLSLKYLRSKLNKKLTIEDLKNVNEKEKYPEKSQD
ncbi:MAG: nitrous oxide-stimulated promoter family protein [Promethearchaeota archaeon]